MKRYGNLFKKITSLDNLLIASKKALRGKREKQALFYFGLETEVVRLKNDLSSGGYQPSDYRQFEIHEPKRRLICCSSFRDRVVHHAICNVLEPIFERRYIVDTYACRPRKGHHAAIKRAQSFSRKLDYFLKCDIRKYFESIDHVLLKTILRKAIKDKDLLSLLDLVIDHKVPGHGSGMGLPIGNLSSQHFANVYLSELDHFLKEKLRIERYIRYMDDFLLFSTNKEHLWNVLKEIRLFLRENLKLELKERETKIAPVSEGIPFLGFRIYRNLIRLRRANVVRFRRKTTENEKAYGNGKISETEMVAAASSMIAHISHADSLNFRRKEFGKTTSLA